MSTHNIPMLDKFPGIVYRCKDGSLHDVTNEYNHIDLTEDGEEILYSLTMDFKGRSRKEIAAYIPYRNRLFHDSSAAGFAEIWTYRDTDNAFYLNLNNSM